MAFGTPQLRAARRHAQVQFDAYFRCPAVPIGNHKRLVSSPGRNVSVSVAGLVQPRRPSRPLFSPRAVTGSRKLPGRVTVTTA